MILRLVDRASPDPAENQDAKANQHSGCRSALGEGAAGWRTGRGWRRDGRRANGVHRPTALRAPRGSVSEVGPALRTKHSTPSNPADIEGKCSKPFLVVRSVGESRGRQIKKKPNLA